MGIAALVLGILGLVLSFVPCLGMYALPLTVIAVILGALAMRSPKDGSAPKGKGMAIAGMILSAVGLLLAIVIRVFARNLFVNYFPGFFQNFLNSRGY
jgi:hypothetical protein